MEKTNVLSKGLQKLAIASALAFSVSASATSKLDSTWLLDNQNAATLFNALNVASKPHGNALVKEVGGMMCKQDVTRAVCEIDLRKVEWPKVYKALNVTETPLNIPIMASMSLLKSLPQLDCTKSTNQGGASYNCVAVNWTFTK